MALGLRSRWGGQVPVPPGPRYGQACDQRAALPQPRVGPKRDESWASRGVDRAWPASDHSSDTWESGISDPDRFDKSIIKLTTKEGTVSSMIHG